MALIQNFPDELLDLHHHWHQPSEHPGSGPGRVHPLGTPGAGLEFLQFHRDFMVSFHKWYDTQPFADQVAVAPWHKVPDELKVAGAGWTTGFANDEIRLNSNSPAFVNADELGAFIERGIHNQFIHGAAAFIYNEPIVGTFHSPLSTYFYQIHGLVDWWWQQWETIHLPNVISRDFIQAILKTLGGVTVDGGGIVITPGGPKPVDPWGPSFSTLTRDRVSAIEIDLQRIQQGR